jgi:hypothetical protein
MSALHTALEALRPRVYSDIPIHDPSAFLAHTFAAAELIVNSVPLAPPPRSTLDQNLSALNNGRIHATCAAEVTASSARPPPVDPEQEKLRDHWGKPLKLAAKDNRLGMSMYKMGANDRHGAWFARRSIHDGFSFDRWRAAMKGEFVESLAVQGGPGAGSVRGIGADRVLERKKVEGMGKLEG